MGIDQMIESIADEFVGVWRFKTLDEGPSNRRWCASVLVSGRLIDTEDYPSLKQAVSRAMEIVTELRP